jgi:hypothetical protein
MDGVAPAASMGIDARIRSRDIGFPAGLELATALDVIRE